MWEKRTRTEQTQALLLTCTYGGARAITRCSATTYFALQRAAGRWCRRPGLESREARNGEAQNAAIPVMTIPVMVSPNGEARNGEARNAAIPAMVSRNGEARNGEARNAAIPVMAFPVMAKPVTAVPVMKRRSRNGVSRNGVSRNPAFPVTLSHYGNAPLGYGTRIDVTLRAFPEQNHEATRLNDLRPWLPHARTRPRSLRSLLAFLRVRAL